MKTNQGGQSTIEFIIVTAFSIGILVVFIQLAINLTGGYLVHYATYMASRTFLVYESAEKDIISDYSVKAPNKAREVFDKYQVQLFGAFDSNGELKFNFWGDGNPQLDYFFTGVYYRYKRPMSILNYLGGGVYSNMHSESFLGKEPTRGECWKRTQKAIETLRMPSNELKAYTTVFDNGC